MKKIDIENKNSTEKIEIPVNVIDEDILDNSEPLFNSEEKLNFIPVSIETNNKYFFWVAFIFILLLAIIFFMASNSPTIEDLRKEKLNQLNEDLKVKTWLMNWYEKLFNENKIKVEKLKTCIEKNSMTWTVVDCNL